MHACDVKDDIWRNAVYMYSDGKRRFARTEVEARAALGKALEDWNGEKSYNEKGERYETNGIGGGLAATLVCTKDTDKALRIVKWEIKKRIVTDWELVDEG